MIPIATICVIALCHIVPDGHVNRFTGARECSREKTPERVEFEEAKSFDDCAWIFAHLKDFDFPNLRPMRMEWTPRPKNVNEILSGE